MRFIFTISILIFVLAGCSNNSQDSNTNNSANSNDYSFDRVSTNYTDNSKNIENSNNTNTQPIETEIASFSTNITYKDINRQKNMSIACSELNGSIIKSGEVFSFCNTLGQSNPEKGYEKAEVFESNGDIIHQYGGRKMSNK